MLFRSRSSSSLRLIKIALCLRRLRCGKRLQALLPFLVESLESHVHLSLQPQVRKTLRMMSRATIDRLLAPDPHEEWRQRLTPSATGLQRGKAPGAGADVRPPADCVYKGWDDQRDLGWLEIDLVAHCGGWMEGSSCGP